MKRIDRMLAYLAAGLCGVLLAVGVLSPPGDWHQPLGLIAGILGLATLAAIILLRRRAWRRWWWWRAPKPKR